MSARASNADLWHVRIPQAYRGTTRAPRPARGRDQPRQPGGDRHRGLGQRAPRRRHARPHRRGGARRRIRLRLRAAAGGRRWSREPSLEVIPFAPAGAPERRGVRGPDRRRLRPSPGVDLPLPARARAPSWGSAGRSGQRRGARARGQEPLRRQAGHRRRVPAHQHRDLPHPGDLRHDAARLADAVAEHRPPRAQRLHELGRRLRLHGGHGHQHAERPLRPHQRQLRRRSASARPPET